MSENQAHDEVLAGLKQIVSEVLRIPGEEITAESKLTDIGMVESIKLLRIAGKIERRFGIELDDEVVFRQGSLAEIVGEILTLRRQQSEETA